MHSALLVDAGAGRVMIDCGRDWLGCVEGVGAAAIVLTHAHPDHAGGLRSGAPCSVYATEETWQAIGRYPIRDRRIADPAEGFDLCGLTFEAVPVEHSLRAPAVGYRIGARDLSLFYAPDVAAIHERSAVLAGLALYVRHGASPSRRIIRWRDGRPIGHASIRDQVGWCAADGVPRAVFTHCGSQIVREEGRVREQLLAFEREHGVSVELARDGMELVLA